MKNSNSILKKKSILFAIALLSSIIFPVSITLMIVGFSKDFTALAIICLILLVASFFGMPLLWVGYSEMGFPCLLYRMITEDKFSQVSLIAETTGKNENYVANEIKKLINKRYLIGYVLIDNQSIINKFSDNFEKTLAENRGELEIVKCPFCGANMELLGGKGDCPYCGQTYSKN